MGKHILARNPRTWRKKKCRWNVLFFVFYFFITIHSLKHILIQINFNKRPWFSNSYTQKCNIVFKTLRHGYQDKSTDVPILRFLISKSSFNPNKGWTRGLAGGYQLHCEKLKNCIYFHSVWILLKKIKTVPAEPKVSKRLIQYHLFGEKNIIDDIKNYYQLNIGKGKH